MKETNPVLECIAARRSVRAYTPEQLTDEEINILLTAAQQAPSARNLQPWHFTVCQDAALMERINAVLCEQMAKGPMAAFASKPDYNVFYHAPTVIFISTDMSAAKRYARHDCGCASQTIALAAQAIGLGTVILGMPNDAFEAPEGAEFRRLLGFPEGYDFMVAVAVGHPAATKEAHPVLEDRVNFVR